MLKRVLASALLLCSGALAAHDDHSQNAHTVTSATLTIEQTWARALPPNAPAAAIYLTINNAGSVDRLLSARTSMAERAELHTTRQEGELLKMVAEEDVEVPAHGTLAFIPGGRHIMLLGLQKPLVAGEHFDLTLVFDKAGEREVRVDIREHAPDAAQAQGHGNDSHAHH